MYSDSQLSRENVFKGLVFSLVCVRVLTRKDWWSHGTPSQHTNTYLLDHQPFLTSTQTCTRETTSPSFEHTNIMCWDGGLGVFDTNVYKCCSLIYLLCTCARSFAHTSNIHCASRTLLSLGQYGVKIIETARIGLRKARKWPRESHQVASREYPSVLASVANSSRERVKLLVIGTVDNFRSLYLNNLLLAVVRG